MLLDQLAFINRDQLSFFDDKLAVNNSIIYTHGLTENHC